MPRHAPTTALVTVIAIRLACAQPDLVITDIHSVQVFTPAGAPVQAYAAGVTTCNYGDDEAPWVASTSQHPVFTQSFYRLSADGSFVQVGHSWVRHGFCALASQQCGLPCTPPNNGCWLGVGCSTTNAAALSGNQASLGPRSDINPLTGEFPFPSTIAGDTDIAGQRLQVAIGDIDQSPNPSSEYFLEIQTVSAAESGSGAYDSVSWARIPFSSGVPGTPGPTIGGENALYAWYASDGTVSVSRSDVEGDGRFHFANRISALEGGLWRYRYVIRNHNVARALGTLDIPLEPGTTITDVVFSDSDPHSGEIYDGTDWTAAQTAGSLRFATPQTFDENPNANALRWGHAFTFEFTADAQPSNCDVTVGIFGPGTPTLATLHERTPGVCTGCACEFDLITGVDVRDLLRFIDFWLRGHPSADLDANGETGIPDLLAFLACWFPASGGAACG